MTREIKRQKIFLVLAIAVVLSAGCGLPNKKVASGTVWQENRPAVIEVVTSIRWKGHQHIVEVIKVNGEEVGKTKKVVVQPGFCEIEFYFKKVINPGNETSFGLLKKTGPGKYVGSVRPIRIEANLEAGRTYYIDTRDMDFFPLGGDYVLIGDPMVRKRERKWLYG